MFAPSRVLRMAALLLSLLTLASSLAACGGNFLSNPYRCDTTFDQSAQKSFQGKTFTGSTQCTPPSTIVFTFDNPPQGYTYITRSSAQEQDYNGETGYTAGRTMQDRQGNQYAVFLILTVIGLTPTPTNATPLPVVKTTLEMKVGPCGLNAEFGCPADS